MDRTERLLDVVALLLDANAPLTYLDIRDAFPDDYAGSVEAGERKFERDKAELLELGIPITWQLRTDDTTEGYVLDKAAYYLPEVGLSAAELAVLYAAGSAALASGAFPGRQDLAHALRKIAFFSDGPPPAPKVRLDLSGLANAKDLPARLEHLWGAINARKWVELDYFSPRTGEVTHRRVDPWGLALRRGLWSLVGYCHLRKEGRTFHVHRVRSLTVNSSKPRSPDFEVPANFRLDDWVAAWPWQHRFHEPIEVTIDLRDDLAPLAASLFALPSAPPVVDQLARVNIRATDLDGLLSYVLSLGPEARVTAPDSAVARFKALAQRIVDAHRGQS